MKIAFKFSVFAGVFFITSAPQAQDYPVKPIRLISPFSPGGATDVLARLVGAKLNERMGQPVVVENRVGAGGNVGADLVAKAPPDGYLLLLGGLPQAISASVYTKLSYDMMRDLSAIADIAAFPSIIALHPSLPVKNVQELIALAKARPGDLNFGSAGNGSPGHLAMELFKALAGINMTHIPYKGGGQGIGDLLGGHLQLAAVSLPVGMQHAQAGRLRAIAVTGATRSPFLPAVPTVSEAGLKGYEVTSWYGVFGPAALPKNIVMKLNTEINTIIVAPDIRERLSTLGAEPSVKTPDQYVQYVRAEIAKWTKVVKASGTRMD